MAVTLRHIADQTGLSRPTISHILNGRKGFNDDTRRRVMRAAESLGYRPLGSALAMRAGTTGAAALVMGKVMDRSNVASPVLSGIHDALADKGLHMMMTRLSDDELTSEQMTPRLLRELTVDGLVINYTHGTPKRLIELVTQYKMPSVWLNKKLPHDCVYPDDFDAGYRATQHLLSLGHRRILLLDASHPANADPDTIHYSVTDRYEGYAAAMTEAGLSPRRQSGSGSRSPREFVAERFSWLRREDRPTAVLAYQDVDAIGVGCAAARMGLDVPRDLSLMTSSYGLDVVEGFGLEVSRMHISGKEVASAVVESLLEKIAEPGQSVPARAIKTIFQPGETATAPL